MSSLRAALPRPFVIVLLAGLGVLFVQGTAVLQGILVIVIAALTLGLLAAVWATPRIKRLAWKWFPTIPGLLQVEPPGILGPVVSGQLIEDKWLPELKEFGDISAQFWDAIREQFGLYGAAGHPTVKNHLDERVRYAEWPDTAKVLDDADELNEDGSAIGPHLSAFWMRRFATDLYKHNTASFEGHRRNLADQVKIWWVRGQHDVGFAKWLGPALGPVSTQTVKLLWFVEVARAESLKNPAPEYGPYIFLREVLTPPDPRIRPDEGAPALGAKYATDT